MSNIYLDYAANTPVDRTVLQAFDDATINYFANPNSTHELGKLANERIKDATANIMHMFKENANLSDDMEIIYTSGSSESNNLAIKGIAKAYKENGKQKVDNDGRWTSMPFSDLTKLSDSRGYTLYDYQYNIKNALEKAF